MTTKPDIAAYHAKLARDFAKRRCCMCNARATVIEIRGSVERNLCLRCAGMFQPKAERA